MKARDFRNLSKEELINRIETMCGDYFVASEEVKVGKEKNCAKLHFLRRDIACAKTVLSESDKK